MSGITLFIRAMQRHRDHVRYAAYLAVRDATKRRQRAEREALAGRHGLQTADLQRRLGALDQIERRERESLAQMARKERRQRINERHVHMPPVAVAAGPAVQASAQSHASRAGSGASAGAILTGNLTALRVQQKPVAAVRIQAAPTRQKVDGPSPPRRRRRRDFKPGM